VWILALSIAALYALICLVFALRQDALIFVPGPAPTTTPAAAGLAYREIAIATPDGERLAAWLIAPRPIADEEPLANRTVILYSHGNAGSIEHRIAIAAALADFGCDVLLYDYRGFGASSGRPSEAGLGTDALAAWELLAGELGYATERIVLFGESLGGAVSIELATRRGARALIVEDTFTSIPALGARLYPWLPVRLLARTRFDSLAKIARVGMPVMILHSPDDELVPFEHGLELFAAAREPKEMLSTEGRHNAGGFRLRPEWVVRVREFVLRARDERESEER
jgi:fermentation-respiration switch protein FrsA (DUF1100 family)